jgi:hypothetical protein
MSCSLNSIFMCFYDVFSNLSSGYFFSKLQGTKVVLDLYVVPSTSTLLYHISDLDCILPVLQRHVCVCTPGVQLHYFCWPTCQTTVIYHTHTSTPATSTCVPQSCCERSSYQLSANHNQINFQHGNGALNECLYTILPYDSLF